MSNERRYYDTLRRIAREYQSAEKLLRGGDGWNGDDLLEMAYENIQGEAAAAIKGKRRPKE